MQAMMQTRDKTSIHPASRLLDLIRPAAERTPTRTAIAAPGRSALSYAALYRHATATAAALRNTGFTATDRIALVLPDAPELATAFLAVSSAATCAPLNPRYRSREFQFFLRDMNATALIVSSGDQTEGPAAAAQLGIPVIRLSYSDNQPAGLFTLDGIPGTGIPESSCVSESTDAVSLVLHTSGTTSQPKLVPLTHANVCASSGNIRSTLALDWSDCCLNVMPLFHVHGLIGCVLSTWAAGASVVIPGRFYAPGFFDLLAEVNPTWFSATPTILQAVLAHAAKHPAIIARHRLRFIRSASSPLSRNTLEQLERTFRVPVVECYGMTEAAHQVASNGPSYAARKPGSVGRAAGPEVAIVDPQGNSLPDGMEGEIVIRGSNVTRGYENNANANDDAFFGDRFRTGDLGHLDQTGYLFINGRIKEIINRGGEKISPTEAEEALGEHEAVSEVGVFGVPDDRLGEEVAAAVVLARKAHVSAAELKQFALTRLADFKVPRHVFFVDALPRSSTGKLRRLELSARFSRRISRDRDKKENRAVTPPRTPTERVVHDIWREVMGLGSIGTDDNFFDLGGDSIQAVMILSRIRAALNRELPFAVFFDEPTIASLAIASLDVRSFPAALTPITHASDPSAAPLAGIQKFIYALENHPLLAGTAALNRFTALRLTGPLDRESLRKSIHGILWRYDILRTRIFQRNGQVLQEPRDMPDFELPEIDVCHCAPEERGGRVQQLAAQQASAPFQLDVGPLVRFCLLRLGESEHVLLFTTHYIVFDAWSMRLFARELVDRYKAIRDGTMAMLPPHPLQYSDFARWQARLESEGRYAGDIAYWQEQLRTVPHFHADLRKRMRGQVSFRLSRHPLVLSSDLTRSARQLAQRENATVFMVLLAALQLTIGRLSGRNDVVVVSQTSGRNWIETEDVIGCFVNLLVLRSRLESGATFVDFLKAVRQTCLEAFSHQNLPITCLLEECLARREVLNDPVSPVIFNFKNFDLPSYQADDLWIEPIDLDCHAEPAGLILKIFDRGGNLEGVVLYNPKLFRQGLVHQLARCYLAALEECIGRPNLPVRDILKWRDILRRLGPGGVWQMLYGVLSFLNLPPTGLHRSAD